MSGKIYIYFNFKLKYIFKINKTSTVCFKKMYNWSPNNLFNKRDRGKDREK